MVSFGDASFASSEDEKSQAGEVLMATRPQDIQKIRDGAYDKGVLLSFRTATINWRPKSAQCPRPPDYRSGRGTSLRR